MRRFPCWVKFGQIWARGGTFRFVLQKMTAWVMVSVSYRSQSVSNFHSSFSTATKNCLIPSSVNSSRFTST